MIARDKLAVRGVARTYLAFLGQNTRKSVRVLVSYRAFLHARAFRPNMRAFAEAWPDPEIVQRVVGRLPWGQNIELLTKLKEPATRLWYAQATLEHGWSRPVLVHQIDTRLKDRQGQAVTNF